MDALAKALLAAVFSGSVISTVISFLAHRRGKRIENEVKHQFEILGSRREWKESAVSQLLAPVCMQLERTDRAFRRWRARNLYLEMKVIGEGNRKARDLLLANGHLIPPELRADANRLIEHYDRWLEKFERQRLADNPDLDAAFTFVGPDGAPFPADASAHFIKVFHEYWHDLYGVQLTETSPDA